jgi:hypothetical protein
MRQDQYFCSFGAQNEDTVRIMKVSHSFFVAFPAKVPAKYRMTVERGGHCLQESGIFQEEEEDCLSYYYPEGKGRLLSRQSS